MKLKKFLPLLVSATFFLPAQIHAAPMTLSVHEADLRSTIMLVAKTGGLNVSIDDSVKGTISVSVSNIEPIKILEIITKTKNLQLVEESGIFIVTGATSTTAIMESYVIPIHYGDPETLRKAVITALDPDTERLASQVTRTRNSDGTTSYRYIYNDKDDDHRATEYKNIKREDRVYVNPEVNALILFGTPAEYERVKNLLATLDVELKQVSVEAKLLAINKDATKNLGIEWMWSTLPQYPDRTAISSDGSRKSDDTTGYGIIKFGRSHEGFPFEFYYGAQINALVTNGKAKILSRPNVTTIQGREAVINVGSSVPIPTTQTTNSTVTTSFDYRDAGIILKYTPRINNDGTITATIHTEVSTPQYVSDLKAYRFNTRSADTTVTVRDGEPMVIGGLIGAEEEKSVSKIPFLGDLPILGALFRNHRKSKSESELIIFLTAHVIGNGEVNRPFEVADDELSDKP
ncbi:MAG: type II secretion system protein GspD [Selenomonadaceae bacterium]|nr:type II secretion system protein GspD [Selenomonadaceae bacterium]